MWVPQEAAALCRRFARDFDGYRSVLAKWSLCIVLILRGSLGQQ